MKAIIPVAGAGTKLRPHTYTQPKALIPIAGKTILSFIMDPLIEAGITEYIFVIGYLGEKIQHFVETNYPELNCHFVPQSFREGSGRAVYLTREIVDGDEVFISMGDTICEYDLQEVLQCPYSCLGVKKVDDPRHFGVAELQEDGSIIQVVEKPQIPKSNMALVGLYKIKESDLLFECLDDNYIHHKTSHDEYHLTDALQSMIEKNVHFGSFKVNNWFDCGRKPSLLEANAILLQKHSCECHSTSACTNSIIVPPVSIGKDCIIMDSIIGPNVSIGEHVEIRASIVHNSIIGSFSKLQEALLNSSIIGSDASIRGVTQSLNIGDNTEIDLG